MRPCNSSSEISALAACKVKAGLQGIVLMFQAIHGMAPSYLQELVHIYKPARTLRSKNEIRITIPKYRTKSYGANSFKVYGAIIWNNLPINLRNIDSLPCFKRAIKTHLFHNAYGL